VANLLCKKIGMITYFDVKGKAVPATILSFENTEVTIAKGLENPSFVYYKVKKNRSNKKSIKRQLGLSEEDAYMKYVRSGISADNIDAVISSFHIGMNVTVTGISKGKGFQSAIKRWGFAGGPRTHGQSDRERAPGSLGSRTIPGRVFKGKKMAGHMGHKRVSICGLKILELNRRDKYMLIGGSVPGPRKSIVTVKSHD